MEICLSSVFITFTTSLTTWCTNVFTHFSIYRIFKCFIFLFKNSAPNAAESVWKIIQYESMRLSFKTVSCLKDTEDLKSEGDLSLVSFAPAAQHNIFLCSIVYELDAKFLTHVHLIQSWFGIFCFIIFSIWLHAPANNSTHTFVFLAHAIQSFHRQCFLSL